MRIRWLSVWAILLLPMAATATQAQASTVCGRLEAQLAKATAGSGAGTGYRRYADAAAKQAAQIRKVEKDLTRFSCASGSFMVLRNENAAICRKLSAADKRMRANLVALERKRDAYRQHGGSQAQRRIEAALSANDCGRPGRTVTATSAPGIRRPNSPGLTAIIGDSGGNDGSSQGKQSLARIAIEPRSAGFGNLRTLCVRTCDGYFFPISSSATSADFGRDERACRMMCPGAEAELYYHAVPTQESEDMISVRTQRPYTELPAAFRYRNAAQPMSRGCSCNMAAFHKEMERREAILNGTSTETSVTTWVRPMARPDPGEDPETIANFEADLTPEDVAAVAAASTAERTFDEKDRQVRIVGPAFLPDQSQTLDLTSGADRLFN